MAHWRSQSRAAGPQLAHLRGTVIHITSKLDFLRRGIRGHWPASGPDRGRPPVASRCRLVEHSIRRTEGTAATAEHRQVAGNPGPRCTLATLRVRLSPRRRIPIASTMWVRPWVETTSPVIRSSGYWPPGAYRSETALNRRRAGRLWRRPVNPRLVEHHVTIVVSTIDRRYPPPPRHSRCMGR